jgi:pilus assembly protein Flp/PilA
MLHRAVKQQRVTAFRTHRVSRVDTTRRERDVMEFVNRMRAFVRDDSGQDLLEYALLVGLIALVAVLAVTNAGTAINGIFTAIATSLASVA